MTHPIEVELSGLVLDELRRRQELGGGDLSQIVDGALRAAFEADRHTLFQVSTSNALAQGVFAGAVTVGTLKQHGDVGVGTLDQLDGELILLGGHCYRASAGGAIREVDDDETVPFAAVTRFTSDRVVKVTPVDNVEVLQSSLDQERASDNGFSGFLATGSFDSLQMRAICRATPGEGLLEASKHQSEFSADEVEGTLVGFWAPGYAHTVGIPGYHFHFISSDRQLGGHVLDVSAAELEIEIQDESLVHLAIPDTAGFRDADLGGDHREEIVQAETKQ